MRKISNIFTIIVLLFTVVISLTIFTASTLIDNEMPLKEKFLRDKEEYAGLIETVSSYSGGKLLCYTKTINGYKSDDFYYVRYDAEENIIDIWHSKNTIGKK